MAKFEPGQPRPQGAGRKKGVTNGDTAKLRELILGALDEAGGQDYLVIQSREEPKAFLALIAKVIPREVENKISGDLSIKTITRQIIDAKPSD
jgi:hypothetical protein